MKLTGYIGFLALLTYFTLGCQGTGSNQKSADKGNCFEVSLYNTKGKETKEIFCLDIISPKERGLVETHNKIEIEAVTKKLDKETGELVSLEQDFQILYSAVLTRKSNNDATSEDQKKIIDDQNGHKNPDFINQVCLAPDDYLINFSGVILGLFVGSNFTASGNFKSITREFTVANMLEQVDYQLEHNSAAVTDINKGFITATTGDKIIYKITPRSDVPHKISPFFSFENVLYEGKEEGTLYNYSVFQNGDQQFSPVSMGKYVNFISFIDKRGECYIDGKIEKPVDIEVVNEGNISELITYDITTELTEELVIFRFKLNNLPLSDDINDLSLFANIVAGNGLINPLSEILDRKIFVPPVPNPIEENGITIGEEWKIYRMAIAGGSHKIIGRASWVNNDGKSSYVESQMIFTWPITVTTKK